MTPSSDTDPAREIDTAPLDQLIAIRQEQARLDAFRVRAESMKEQVDEPVYRRVLNDYAGRHAALERRAAPLKTQAGAQFRTLLALRSRTETAHETARLVRQELQFRHAVGELDEVALAAQVREPEQTLERCRVELESLDALKARFVEAFGSEADLQRAAESEAAPSEPVAVSEAVAASEPPSREAPPSASAPIQAPQDDEGLETEYGRFEASPNHTNIFALPESPADATQEEGEGERESSHTANMTSAVLIEATDAAQPVRHTLGVTASVGRSEDNSVRLGNPSVSRQHAILTATPAGYVVRDLHSQNGTFVNGVRIETHPLQDGDEVIFGDAVFTFRAFAAGTAPEDEPSAQAAAPPQSDTQPDAIERAPDQAPASPPPIEPAAPTLRASAGRDRGNA